MARKMVEISLRDLTLLCLGIDYGLPEAGRDEVEGVSVRLAKKHGFDTHEFRIRNMEKYVTGTWQERARNNTECKECGQLLDNGDE